jgi:predicted RNA-binding protein YlxR (DUF448 family)/ribosomal protein L30E
VESSEGTATEIDELDEGTDTEVDGPERRCVATGAVLPKASLIRFVIGPDSQLVPDLDARLPGRGLYLRPSPAAFAEAMKKRAFAKAARRPVTVPEDLGARLESLLVGRVQNLLGLARRAGQAVIGYDQAAAWLKAGRVRLLVQAGDAAEGGRARLRAMAGARPVLEPLTAVELAAPFGREHVVHVAVAAGGLAVRLEQELARLSGLRALDRKQDGHD